MMLTESGGLDKVPKVPAGHWSLLPSLALKAGESWDAGVDHPVSGFRGGGQEPFPKTVPKVEEKSDAEF